MRTTISLDDSVAALAEKVATRERRNFSKICEVALAEYCAARVEDPADAKVAAAIVQLGGPKKVLPILTRAAARSHAKEVAA